MEYLQYAYEKLFGYATDGTHSGFNTPRKVVCFGNVLLDQIIKLEDPEMLQRYDLELGSKGEMELEKMNKIVMEASENANFKCLRNPGGSALNTVRILKQLGTDAQFFGAVGADKHAEQLRHIFQECGIEARLQTIEGEDTGQCICLMYQDNPTLYANIGASARFSLDELKLTAQDDTQSFLRPIERKQILYIEGFFLPQRTQVCDYIVTHFVRERRRLAVNLSAPYIVEQHSKELLALAHRALFVFGNRLEFEALCAAANCKSVEELARQLMKSDGEAKIILITNGAEGVQLITNFVSELEPPGDFKIEIYRAQCVDEVVDATGAGDAFVAGFLHAWLEKRSLGECVRVAADVAAKVVTQVGCNLPKNP